jgi:hypothetical protein
MGARPTVVHDFFTECTKLYLCVCNCKNQTSGVVLQDFSMAPGQGAAKAKKAGAMPAKGKWPGGLADGVVYG